jgi:beta-glucosidase
VKRNRAALPHLSLVCMLSVFMFHCAPRPDFDGEPPGVDALGKGFPARFLWGTSTAAHQIEGGLTNQWTEWENGAFEDGTPHIKNNDRSGLATDSWNRFADDLQLMKQAGTNTYRFSVEWSRIQPSRGEWNQAAIDRYRSWARQLRENGIEPMVTLFHFTLPLWVVQSGGFESDTALDDFELFSRRMAKELAAEVDWWCTVNEPNVYASNGWLVGEFPPGKKGDTKTQAEVTARILEAHARSSKALRQEDVVDADGDGKNTIVTFAHHVRVFQPASPGTLDTAISGLSDDFFNESIVRALKTGRIVMNVPGAVSIDRNVPGLKDSIDVLGINYYTRGFVRTDLGSPSFSQMYSGPDRPVSDLGWDLYPGGLYAFVKRFNEYGWPIVITENGIATTDAAQRQLYLRRHIWALERAVADGVKLQGYIHWSLLDNFEWAQGYSARFGLFSVDFANGRARSATPAADDFRIIGANIPK